MWRACSNCLHTRDNLHRRRMKVEPTCESCRQQPETVSHLLWTCPFGRNVWALFKGRTQKCSNEACDFFFLFFKQMQSKLSKVELERWAVTAWAIWNARNKYYFEKTQHHLKQILDSAGGLIEEYQRLVDTQRVA